MYSAEPLSSIAQQRDMEIAAGLLSRRGEHRGRSGVGAFERGNDSSAGV